MTKRKKEKQKIKELEEKLEYLQAAELARELGITQRAIEDFCMAGQPDEAAWLYRFGGMPEEKIRRKVRIIMVVNRNRSS